MQSESERNGQKDEQEKSIKTVEKSRDREGEMTDTNGKKNWEKTNKHYSKQSLPENVVSGR